MASAVYWYRKSAELGYAKAQYNLGMCYYYGQGVSKDISKALKWWRRAAEQGLVDAQYNLATHISYYGDGDDVDNFTDIPDEYDDSLSLDGSDEIINESFMDTIAIYDKYYINTVKKNNEKQQAAKFKF